MTADAETECSVWVLEPMFLFVSTVVAEGFTCVELILTMLGLLWWELVWTTELVGQSCEAELAGTLQLTVEADVDCATENWSFFTTCNTAFVVDKTWTCLVLNQLLFNTKWLCIFIISNLHLDKSLHPEMLQYHYQMIQFIVHCFRIIIPMQSIYINGKVCHIFITLWANHNFHS